ncbi:PKD domain-containing protein [bacterium]|nr:PKD domain-containing protein [bacterium]
MKITGLLFVVLSFLLVGCSDHIAPDFSFSPPMPKCGQTVTFTNLTTGDADWTAESWNWDFGDNGTSTLKTPTHIYRKAGIYTVSLKVDSSKITVYDSIPTIIANVDSIKFFQNVTFSTLIYNPTGATITYDWSFSENAKSLTNTTIDTTASTVSVFFNKFNIEEEVKLKVTVGDSVYNNIKFTFKVHDYKAKSVLMAQKDGKILRKRIFINGMEDAVELPVSAGKHPFNITAINDKLYIFDAGSSVEYNSNWIADTNGDGSIRVVDLKNSVATEIANNRNSSSHFGFYNGYVDSQNIYWTDYSEFVYSVPVGQTVGNFDWKENIDAQTSNSFYKVKTDRLGYFGKGLASNQFSGGIRYYDNAYYWAKGGSGRGIYRFLPTDILAANATSNTPIPTLGAILTDFAIRAFVFDEIHAKIYFSVTAPADKIGLWVSNLNGANPQRIEAEPLDNASLYITGIAVDNESNRLYWAYRGTKSGVKMMPLVTNDLNKVTGTIEFFLLDVEVYGIAVDKVRR